VKPRPCAQLGRLSLVSFGIEYKQIFCECKIGNEYIQTNFIQVENLKEKGIIGADILKKYDAQIKFSEQTIQFKIDKVLHKYRSQTKNLD